MNTDKQNETGIGFCGLLTIVFVTLRLLGAITWSWWWVLSPIWAPAVVAVAVLLVVLLIAYIAERRLK